MCLQLLAPELLMRIQLFLNPKDIYSLRKCCKKLYAASRERSVWINAVKQICIEFGAFESSFPTESMTLSELEYVATCSNRFAQGLLNELNFHTPLAPINTELLEITSRNHTADIPLGQFVDFTLISGGRFLVTITDSRLLQLWDLGYAFKKRREKALASKILSKSPVWVDAGLSANNKDLIIGVASAESTCFTIYKINPCCSLPLFECISSFDFEGDSNYECQVYPACHRVAMWLNGIVNIWDYESRSMVRWQTDGINIHNIMLLENSILMFHTTGVQIYEIPDMHSANLSPVLCVSLSDSQFCVSTPLHKVGYRDLQFVETISSEDLNGDQMIKRYLIEPVPKGPSESLRTVRLPSFLPIYRDYYVTRDIVGGHAFWSVDSGDCRLLFWDDGDVCVSASRVDRRDLIQRKSGLLYGGAQVYYDLCPMSGRLCVLEDDRYEIRIVDFVSLPP